MKSTTLSVTIASPIACRLNVHWRALASKAMSPSRWRVPQELPEEERIPVGLLQDNLGQ